MSRLILIPDGSTPTVRSVDGVFVEEARGMSQDLILYGFYEETYQHPAGPEGVLLHTLTRYEVLRASPGSQKYDELNLLRSAQKVVLRSTA